MVRYCEGTRIEVGYDALKAQKIDPLNTISSVKRMIGRTLVDTKADNHYYPYRFGASDRIIELHTPAKATKHQSMFLPTFCVHT